MSAAPRRRLDLAALHKLGAYVMVGSTFAALWGGRAFPDAAGAACLLLGVASWFWEPPRINPERFARLWTALTIGFIALCGALLAFTPQGVVDVGVYLVLYLSVAKLFQRVRLVDYQQLFALSFLLLAAATAFNEDITFGLVFIIYVVVGVVTFAMHHLLTQIEENAARGGAHVRQLFGRQYITLLVGLALLIFGASTSFFFLFPRLGFGFFVSQSRDGAQTTGFSESVDLGSHGRIKDDPTVIMRIEFPEGRPDDLSSLHWRGISFDTYDGTRWTSRVTHDRALGSDRDDVYAVQPKPEWAGASLLQRIYLEPIGSSVLFALHPAVSLQLADKDQGAAALLGRHRVSLSSGGDLRHTTRARPGEPYQAMTVGYQYTVTSWLTPPPPERLALNPEDRLRGLSSHGAEAYLQLPPDAEPIAALTRDLTADATDDLQRVIAVQEHLRTRYTYTTDLPDPGDRPPLLAFLFDHKRGHCEYFATAMVIMLRTQGIPARNVNGFLGGQWNDFDDFLAVRNADAHSWVEVWFPDVGWVTFDPTPGGAAAAAAETSFFDPFRKAYDSLRFKWMKYIIEYDLETQVDLLRTAAAAIGGPEEEATQPREFAFTLRDLLEDARRNLLPAALILLLASAGGLFIRLRAPRPLAWLDLGAAVGAVGASFGVALLLWRPGASTPVLLVAVALPLTFAAGAAWARRRRLPARALPASAIARSYTTLRDALYRHALDPRPAEGPEALAARVSASTLPERDAIARAITRYMVARFGGRPLPPDEARAWTREVQRLAKALRKLS